MVPAVKTAARGWSYASGLRRAAAAAGGATDQQRSWFKGDAGVMMAADQVRNLGTFRYKMCSVQRGFMNCTVEFLHITMLPTEFN